MEMPHMPAVRTAAAMLLVAALSMLGSACGDAKTSGSTTGTDAAGTTKDTSGGGDSTDDEAPAAAIGDEVESNTWKLTVSKVSRAATAGGATAATGYELVVVELSLTNGGSEGEGIGPVSLKLTGPDDASFPAAPTSATDFIFNTPQPINAGETRAVKVAYEVPKGTSDLTLTFEPFVEGETLEPVTVDLG